METLDKTSRVASFSSSSNHKLVKDGRGSSLFSAPGVTYIDEKKMEMRLGRPLNSENSAKPTNWGKFLEKRVFDLLGMEYQLESRTRFAHETITNWTGAPDTLRDKVVGDIKCPWTMKSFCKSIDCMNSIPEFRAERPEYYWQLVSNAILTDKPRAEIIIYCPYEDELEAIREEAYNYDGDQNKISFINWAENEELPYLIEGGYYKNLNKFEFEIPLEDIAHLTHRIQEAVKLLHA